MPAGDLRSSKSAILLSLTNCSHCGPRFSIIEGPYPTIARTSMQVFEMCPECAKEYHNPGNRQFLAQANASPKCRPELELWDEHGISSWRRRVAAPPRRCDSRRLNRRCERSRRISADGRRLQ